MCGEGDKDIYTCDLHRFFLRHTESAGLPFEQQQGAEIEERDSPETSQGVVSSMVLSRDGSLLVTGDISGQVVVRDSRSLSILRILPHVRIQNSRAEFAGAVLTLALRRAIISFWLARSRATCSRQPFNARNLHKIWPFCLPVTVTHLFDLCAPLYVIWPSVLVPFFKLNYMLCHPLFLCTSDAMSASTLRAASVPPNPLHVVSCEIKQVADPLVNAKKNTFF